MRLITTLLATLLSAAAFAGHHGESQKSAPVVMEIFECDLNKGVPMEDLLEFGREDFASLFSDANLDMSGFVWEPMSIAPPYEQTGFRWVNYYPSWGSYQAADDLWASNKAANVRKDSEKLSTCKMPIFMHAHMVVQTEKPLTMVGKNGNRLLIGRCNINESATLNDVKEFNSEALSKATRSAAGSDRGQFLAMPPRIGIDPDFDFLNILFGTPSEIAKLLDGARTGKIPAARKAFTDTPNPSSCDTWDLHRSHRVFVSES